MVEVPRVGRPANPAERGLQLVMESPSHLTHVAINLMGHTLRVDGYAKRHMWKHLTRPEREQWKQRALADIRTFTAAYTANYTPPEPYDPDPGASRPVCVRVA